MSEIKNRLKEAADACVASYDKWSISAKDADARESLLEAVHELRKAAARLEIEIAVSERRQVAADPIPIPAHRAQRRQFPAQNDFEDDGNNIGNGNGGNNQGGGRREFRDRDRAQSQQPAQHQPRAEISAGEGGSQTIRIRRSESEAAPAPARDSAPAKETGGEAPAGDAEGGDDKPRRGRPPLSLKRSGGDDTGAA